jgi:DNA-binding MarR family transcriptional regulator
MERLTRLIRAAEHGADLNPAQWEALRFLARANSFSNTPTALTRYLGATKGTTSQTLKALERKGYIVKSARPEERRSVMLTVTAKGFSAVADSPWTALEQEAENLNVKTLRRTAKGLRSLLATALKKGQHASFGNCSDCRHFNIASRCMVFDVEVPVLDQTKVCVAHAPLED